MQTRRACVSHECTCEHGLCCRMVGELKASLWCYHAVELGWQTPWPFSLHPKYAWKQPKHWKRKVIWSSDGHKCSEREWPFLVIYICLLVQIIPTCRAQACLLYTPRLPSLSFIHFILNFLFLAFFVLNWLEGRMIFLQRCGIAIGLFSLEAELCLKVQTSEHLYSGVHEALTLMVLVYYGPNIISQPWLFDTAAPHTKPGIN